jgi:hypothetical protein
VTGHELKGLQHYYHCNVNGLHFPLMALIDYRGWRLMAISLLPIDDTTLVYGSADGGLTVKADNQEMNEMMEMAGKMMRLKGHRVGTNKLTIYSCCDIEGHKGKDNRFYLLDFARVAPPDVPTGRGTNLHKLLRMEFIRNFDVPLCSDAFSKMGADDHQSHAAEIQKAHQHLVETRNDFLEIIFINICYCSDSSVCTEVQSGGVH